MTNEKPHSELAEGSSVRPPSIAVGRVLESCRPGRTNREKAGGFGMDRRVCLAPRPQVCPLGSSVDRNRGFPSDCARHHTRSRAELVRGSAAERIPTAKVFLMIASIDVQSHHQCRPYGTCSAMFNRFALAASSSLSATGASPGNCFEDFFMHPAVPGGRPKSGLPVSSNIVHSPKPSA